MANIFSNTVGGPSGSSVSVQPNSVDNTGKQIGNLLTAGINAFAGIKQNRENRQDTIALGNFQDTILENNSLYQQGKITATQLSTSNHTAYKEFSSLEGNEDMKLKARALWDDLRGSSAAGEQARLEETAVTSFKAQAYDKGFITDMSDIDNVNSGIERYRKSLAYIEQQKALEAKATAASAQFDAKSKQSIYMKTQLENELKASLYTGAELGVDKAEQDLSTWSRKWDGRWTEPDAQRELASIRVNALRIVTPQMVSLNKVATDGYKSQIDTLMGFYDGLSKGTVQKTQFEGMRTAYQIERSNTDSTYFFQQDPISKTVFGQTILQDAFEKDPTILPGILKAGQTIMNTRVDLPIFDKEDGAPIVSNLITMTDMANQGILTDKESTILSTRMDDVLHKLSTENRLDNPSDYQSALKYIKSPSFKNYIKRKDDAGNLLLPEDKLKVVWNNIETQYVDKVNDMVSREYLNKTFTYTTGVYTTGSTYGGPIAKSETKVSPASQLVVPVFSGNQLTFKVKDGVSQHIASQIKPQLTALNNIQIAINDVIELENILTQASPEEIFNGRIKAGVFDTYNVGETYYDPDSGYRAVYEGDNEDGSPNFRILGDDE